MGTDMDEVYWKCTISLYPNPATTVVNIYIGNSHLLNINVQLMDAKGARLQVIRLSGYNQQLNTETCKRVLPAKIC